MMKITKRLNPSGKTVYQVDLGRGKGGRKSYSTKGEAERAFIKAKDRLQRHGSLADELTAEEMAEVITCRRRVTDAGATLSEAVEFFLAHGKRLHESLSVPDLAQRFQESRRAMGVSIHYLRGLKCSLGSLATFYPVKQADQLTSRDVQAWITANDWQPKTRRNYLGDVSAMFEWAMLPTQRFARMNPCTGIEREPKKRRGKTASLSTEQAEQLLRAAHAKEDWRILAYLTVSLFGGLRPEAEAADQKFHWSAVNLDERHIHLTEEIVKTGPGRTVDLTENAVKWLKLIPESLRAGPVVPIKNWQEEWMRFRHYLGWRVATERGIEKRGLRPVEIAHGEWPNDVLRHTYASMHYAHHQNEAALQVQMGHRSAKMLHEHYRAVRTRKEAAAFWDLAPK